MTDREAAFLIGAAIGLAWHLGAPLNAVFQPKIASIRSGWLKAT